MSTFGRSYQYASPSRIGPGPYSRLRVVGVAMDAWQDGYKSAIKDVRLRKRRAQLKAKQTPTQQLYARKYRA